MARQRKAPLDECVAQLRITTGLLATLAVQRGVPAETVKRVSGIDVPDPLAPLVPYARALLSLQLVTARALGVDARCACGAAMEPEERECVWCYADRIEDQLQ